MNLESDYNQENPVEKMMYYFNKACQNEAKGKLTALMEIYEDYIIDAQNPFDFFQSTMLKPKLSDYRIRFGLSFGLLIFFMDFQLISYRFGNLKLVTLDFCG